MNLETLLKMKEAELKHEYATAKRQSNMTYMTLINTIRVRNMILSAFEKFPDQEGKLIYYEHDKKTYLIPQVTEYIPSIRGDVEWLVAAHISGGNPVPIDIELLKTLVSEEHIEFQKNDTKIEIPLQENIVNYNYMTEDVVEVHLPDVWVPNGLEELQVAVSDMPKNDQTAVLLTNCDSYLIIGEYMTSNRTFTDVFYSHNSSENMPKAIILNDIAGVDEAMLERELQNQDVFYHKKANVLNNQIVDTYKMPIDLNLSTIWTAKYKEIIEDAIRDSLESADFSPTLTKIYNIPSQIVTSIQYEGETIGVRASYNTIILFDGKLILFDDITKDDKKADISKLFMDYGLPSLVTDESIDLSQFENSIANSMKNSKRKSM